MSIRRGLFLLSIVTLAGALLGGAYRLFFLARAERATGVVVDVQGENSKCGRRAHRDCTRFHAIVEFQAAGAGHSLRVPAGRLMGHDLPVSRAETHVGDSVPVLFDPGNPDRAARDDFWGRWGPTLLVLALSAACLIGSFGFSGSGRERDTGEIISLGLGKQHGS
jgi:hypothetical protein